MLKDHIIGGKEALISMIGLLFVLIGHNVCFDAVDGLPLSLVDLNLQHVVNN